MFVIAQSEMSSFVYNISSFPTVIYTVLLGVCIVFWLIAVLGFVELDLGLDLDLDLDLDIDLDVDMDIDGIAANSGEVSAGTFVGLLSRLGLVGVPITISFSILVMVGWLLSYYSVHFLFPLLPNPSLSYLVGVPILLITLYIGAKATGFIIRPLKPLFAKASQKVEKKILGQTVTVRTSRVDADFGEAVFEDGGAGLILKIRSKNDEAFTKGDRVVILQKLGDDNIYQVISEKEFLN